MMNYRRTKSQDRTNTYVYKLIQFKTVGESLMDEYYSCKVDDDGAEGTSR